MRRTVVVLAVCGVLAGTVAALARPGVQLRPTALLRVAAAAPLTVAGRHFRPHERARITVRVAGARTTRTIRAGETGSFRVVFQQLAASRCDALRVVVTRRSGAAVVLKRLPAPACLLS